MTVRFNRDIVRTVPLNKNKQVILLVLTVFVLALGGCVLACADDAAVCAEDSLSCSCLCQMPILLACDNGIAPDFGAKEFGHAPTQLKLHLIVNSIFNPPRA